MVGTKTGRNCKSASFLWREESVHGGLVFIGYGMYRNCLKIVYGDSVLKKCKNQNEVKKIIIKKSKKKNSGSIIGPAMAGPTGPFATALVRGSVTKQRLVIPRCSTNELKNSFVPRTIVQWNALPDSTTSAASVNAFRSQLYKSCP